MCCRYFSLVDVLYTESKEILGATRGLIFIKQSQSGFFMKSNHVNDTLCRQWKTASSLICLFPFQCILEPTQLNSKNPFNAKNKVCVSLFADNHVLNTSFHSMFSQILSKMHSTILKRDYIRAPSILKIIMNVEPNWNMNFQKC